MKVVSGLDGEPRLGTACLCSHSLNELDFAVNQAWIWARGPGVKIPSLTLLICDTYLP